VLHVIKWQAKAAALPLYLQSRNDFSYSGSCRPPLPEVSPPAAKAFATGITAYLQNGGTLEHAQQIAAHQSPRTTKLYDRTKDEISLDEVERITF
jgi:hypothetical protein